MTEEVVRGAADEKTGREIQVPPGSRLPWRAKVVAAVGVKVVVVKVVVVKVVAMVAQFKS
jgi:hypothetical protein